uniref:Uncharacterized protein MANES_01G236200 n=1 Tax=Rhizophora mucronata TaxID=61149 RepID=A0A2P2MZG8_RHIMU
MSAFAFGASSSIKPYLQASYSKHNKTNPFVITRKPVNLTTRSHLLLQSRSCPRSSKADSTESTSLNGFRRGGGEDEDDAASFVVVADEESDSKAGEDGVFIGIKKLGNYSRRIRSEIVIDASLETIWNLLTDYERLADFIPGLAVSKLIDKKDNFARLYQIGQQNLVFGLKFNAKATLDCYERDLEILDFGERRDIEFKMIEGDFHVFEGKWSIEQFCKSEDSDFSHNQEFQTILSYFVDVKPKLWLPVHLIEGRLCKEIKTNLLCIRQEAQKVIRNMHVQ